MSWMRREIWGWALYDWANSAFATTVMSGFFPVFFKQFWSVDAAVNLSTAKLGLANSLAGLAVALLAPILGAIADRRSAKKRFLIFFAYLGALMTAGLFLVERGQWAWAVFCYVGGNVGFAGANVFYDALLPDVTRGRRMDFVSGLGFAMGYLGGGLLFLVNVLMVLMPGSFGLESPAQAIRISFLMVALWWGGFTLLTILWVPEEKRPARDGGLAGAVAQGLKQLRVTFHKTRQLKTVGLFLLAYWFYIDGVDTIIRMAVDYGMSLGFSSNDLITALLIVQFVGFPAALGFGRLAEVWGVRPCLFLAIGAYMVVTVLGALITRPLHFYVLAVVIGLFQGGIQALSRSYYARLIPAGQSAEFYGFYNMLGKFAAILGPALMGGVGLLALRMLSGPGMAPAELAGAERLASRISILSILVLLGVGAALLRLVDERRGAASAER